MTNDTKYTVRFEDPDYMDRKVWVVRGREIALDQKKNAVQIGKALARDESTRHNSRIGVTVEHMNGKKDTYYFRNGDEV